VQDDAPRASHGGKRFARGRDVDQHRLRRGEARERERVRFLDARVAEDRRERLRGIAVT